MKAKRKIASMIILVVIIIGFGIYYFYDKHFKHLNNFHAKPTQQVVLNSNVVKPSNLNTPLFFSGTIAPLTVYNVTAPIAGTVQAMGFQYGQRLQKGQFLVDINSDSSEKNYRDALADYLKSKDSYLTSQNKLSSQQALYKDGLVAKTDLDSAKSDLENNRLAFRQAIFALKNSISKITTSVKQQQQLYESLTSLKLGDKAVDQALSKQFNDIRLHTQHSGVALYPGSNSGNDSSGSSGSKVNVGSELKAGQVIVGIGDLSGISVAITVNEISVNKVKPGQKVIITGVAFPDTKLNGYVQSVGAEAKDDSSGGLPTFPVTVVVPKLTAAQRKVIHIGMSAQVQLILNTPKAIMIPINDVEETANGNFVTVVRNGSKQKIRVITGQTTIDKVAITQGLQPGDKVVSPTRTQ